MPEPGTPATWQVWAVRVATAERPARDNFLSPGDRCGAAAIDFVVFVLIGGDGPDDEVVVVDTGFSREAGARRGRVLELGAGDAVRALGRDPEDVRTVVLSHLHYDHAGNVDDFPNAQVVIQRAELEYTTGPAMRHHRLSHFFEVDDVAGVVRRLYAGGVTVVEGDRELRPGVEVRLIGGHTRGTQVVRVHTARGWVVLACDAVHYFDNLAERNPFPALVDVEQVLDGYERIESLASSADHIVPGHDPQLFDRHERKPDLRGRVIAALHRPTVADGAPTDETDDMSTDADFLAEFRRSVASFAAEHLAPGALARAHQNDYPRDVARLLAKQGLLGLSIPENRGGQGAGLMAAITAIQAVAAHCPRSADIVQAGNFGPIRTFAEYATDEQRERYLPGLLSGDLLMSLGMSEPDAGSAATELTTSAMPSGDGWVVNGTKVFSTHSADADVYLVYARFGPGIDGIGSVLIDRGTPGSDRRPAVAVHERRALVPAVLRRLPHPG